MKAENMGTIHQVSLRTNDLITMRGTDYYHRRWKYDNKLCDVLAQVMDLGNHQLLNHSIRVAYIAVQIARRLNLTDEQIELTLSASLFHDIGKLGLPQAILSKPGSLTRREYDIIKSHSELSVTLLQECPDSGPLIPIIRHHHESFDGNGYPDKISGTQIEIEARIIAVADTIDAMISDRPYRAALSLRQIIKELRRCTGTQFDPIVVKVAIQILMEIEKSKQV